MPPESLPPTIAAEIRRLLIVACAAFLTTLSGPFPWFVPFAAVVWCVAFLDLRAASLREDAGHGLRESDRD